MAEKTDSARITNEQVQAELRRRGYDDCLYTMRASAVRDEMEAAERRVYQPAVEGGA